MENSRQATNEYFEILGIAVREVRTRHSTMVESLLAVVVALSAAF